MWLGELTKAGTSAELQRLAMAYGKPFGVRAEAQVEVYYQVLRFALADDVTASVTQWIETRERWPTPASLRKLVQVRHTAREGTARDTQRAKPAHCDGCSTPYVWRSWYVIRRSARDTRRVVVEYATGTGQADLVVGERMLCDCGYRASLRLRVTPELDAMRQEGNPFAAEELRHRAAVAAKQAPEAQAEEDGG